MYEFFKHAGFQGGTCLRIVYGLGRFSEDLAFVLFKEDENFQWQRYFEEIIQEFKAYDLSIQVTERDKAEDIVKKAFLKENSFGTVLNLKYARNKSDIRSLKIKLEIDTNPPKGSEFETKILDFPSPYTITTQSKPSLFATKLHALLCRDYIKGRDWYDFIWYVTQKIKLNEKLLQAALFQNGPWENQNIEFNQNWLLSQLQNKVKNIDWKVARSDVINFIKPHDHDSINLWSKEFFEHYLEKLSKYLSKY